MTPISADDLTNALADVNSKLARLLDVANQGITSRDSDRRRIPPYANKSEHEPAVLAALQTSQLASSLLEQLGGLEGRVEWTAERNHRRCELIDKRITGTITDAESIELLRLQAAASAYRKQKAPLPVAGAKRLHAELLARKAEREHAADQ